MVKTYIKLWSILDKQERKSAILLLGGMMLMGLSEALGVASIMPFMSVVSDPGIVHKNETINKAYQLLGGGDVNDFLITLGFSVFAVLLLSLSVKALTVWAMARFSHMRNYTLSSRLLRIYLSKPYSWFLMNHTSELGKTVLSEVQEVIVNSMIPAVQFIASAVVVLFLVGLLIVVDPFVAITGFLFFGFVYVLIFLGLKKYLLKLGVNRVNANKERFRVSQEVLGGVKEVKICSLEDKYLDGYKSPAMIFSKALADNQVAGQLPRFLIEGLAFGSLILVLTFYISSGRGELNSILPVIGLYVFAGYKLLPMLQQAYQSIAKMKYGEYALERLYQLAKEELTDSDENKGSENSFEIIKVNDEICLNDLTYIYKGTTTPVLKNFNLKIPAYNTVALVGSTGAGKSTVVDILMGLLTPDHGVVTVDGLTLNKDNVKCWQKNIGYVPQSIFLFDDTIAKNIAFSEKNKTPDMDAVITAAKAAELHEFITSDLPDGYETVVGERGVRLSGGQRQRIGIARALYHNPDVLVLDEATSALDSVTERAVMGAVNNLGHKKTIIIIAHRLSTVRECDTIFVLDKGKVTASGSFDLLYRDNKLFRTMVGDVG